MADVYSAIILADAYWNGSSSWAGETSEGNRDTKYGARRYTSLSDWEIARDGASSGGDDEYAVIIGPWASNDTTAFIIAGWSADAVIIQCPLTLPDGVNAARHNGIPGDLSNTYRLLITTDAYPIDVAQNSLDVTIDGLWVSINHQRSGIRFSAFDSTGIVENCIIDHDYVGSFDYGISIEEPGTYYIYNNVIQGFLEANDEAVQGGNDAGATVYVYNNTVQNCRRGILSDVSTIHARNNAVFNNTDDFVGSFDTLTHNASDDGDGTSEVDWDSEATDWNANFEDYTTYDHTPLDADLPGAGIGPGSDANVPTTDIIGNARSGATCTIGAFEYGAVQVGSVCWGHDTGITQDNTRDFSGNWTGTGTISGAGDAEIITFETGQYEESEVVNVGAGSTQILLNDYVSGTGTPTIKYKDGNSVANCEADTWNTYSAPFVSLGYVQVRIEG